MKPPTDPRLAFGGLPRFAAVACLVVAATLGAGCAVLPVPTPRHVPLSFTTRGAITPRMLDAIHPGVTTRAEVLLLLGEPDRVWDGERFLLYRWASVGGYALWILAGGYQGVGGAEPFGRRQCDLLLECDEWGVVAWQGDLRAWRSRSGNRELLPDSIPSVALPVRHRHAADSHPGTLTLTGEGISFGEPGRPGHGATIARDGVRSLDHDVIAQSEWAKGGIGCTLIYATADDPRRERRLHLIVGAEHLPLLHRSLERWCPAARIGN